MNSEEILIELAEKYIKILGNAGYIPGGHNGPYLDEETPVRSCSHWISIFAYLHLKTNKIKYYQALNKCAEFLLSKAARPMDEVFFCRKNPNKDFSNGLMGQAWGIEGLVTAYEFTKNDVFLDLAADIFLKHPFDCRLGLWKTVNVDGSYSNYDITFNHQLWFAATASLIVKHTQNETIVGRINVFMKKIKLNLRCYNNGLIKHKVIYHSSFIKSLLQSVYLLQVNVKAIFSKKSMKYKENGYHIFNLYAFAILKSSDRYNDFFKSSLFKKILFYTFSNKHKKMLDSSNHKSDLSRGILPLKKVEINRYGYGYNAPGFELPYIFRVFNYRIGEIDGVIEKQINLTFDSLKVSFCNNTEDTLTLDSRMYELIRYLELEDKKHDK